MSLDNILSLVGLPNHRSRRNMMMCSIFKIAISMIAGIALGFAVSYWCEGKMKRGKSQKSTSESGSDENNKKKSDCIKQDIKSGYKDVKQGVENAIDKVSDLYSDTQD